MQFKEFLEMKNKETNPFEPWKRLGFLEGVEDEEQITLMCECWNRLSELFLKKERNFEFDIKIDDDTKITIDQITLSFPCIRSGVCKQRITKSIDANEYLNSMKEYCQSTDIKPYIDRYKNGETCNLEAEICRVFSDKGYSN